MVIICLLLSKRYRYCHQLQGTVELVLLFLQKFVFRSTYSVHLSVENIIELKRISVIIGMGAFYYGIQHTGLSAVFSIIYIYEAITRANKFIAIE